MNTGYKSERGKAVLIWLLRVCMLAVILWFVGNARETLPDALVQNIHSDWFKPKQSQYKGVIRMWNIYDMVRFDTDVLRTAVRKFERANRGAFVEYITIDSDKANKRIESGESPDVWVYPSELTFRAVYMGDVELPPLEADNILTEDFEFDVEDDDKDDETAQNRRFKIAHSCGDDKLASAQLLCEAIIAEGVVHE